MCQAKPLGNSIISQKSTSPYLAGSLFVSTGGYCMEINEAGDPVGAFPCAHDVDCKVPIRYMQFVHTDLVSGSCYYYEAGSSLGKSGQHTWRYDP